MRTENFEMKAVLELREQIRADEIKISVQSMDDGRNVRCSRCWHWHGVVENFGHLPEEIEADPELSKEKLCDGCQQIILNDFPDHPAVPHIKTALEAQHKKYLGGTAATALPEK